jgi:hypothetical protein
MTIFDSYIFFVFDIFNMVLQSTGSITLSDIQTELGGLNPISLSEYYQDADTEYSKGITSVPNKTLSISFSNFYNVSFVYNKIYNSSTINKKAIYIFTQSMAVSFSKNWLCDVLIVGGGGAGANGSLGGNGGGGGGGVVYQINKNINSNTYYFTIGSGGTKAVSGSFLSNNGSSSSIRMNDVAQTQVIIDNQSTITYDAHGGGAGAYSSIGTLMSAINGRNGGSGGGGGGYDGSGTGGSATQPATFYNGSTNIAGGKNGSNGTGGYTGKGGNGGGGFSVNITGETIMYAQGGIGQAYNRDDTILPTTPGSGGNGGMNGYAGIIIIKTIS